MTAAGSSSGPALCAERSGSLTGMLHRGVAAAHARLRSGGERKERVFDITVADEHEFFANGVLVSNCDSVRMVAYFLACNKKEFAFLRSVIIDRHRGLLDEEDNPVEELEKGYYSLNTAAMYQ